ncbi:MAG: hypothetical protein Q8R02_07465 [Hyphomonadaceae bacterium]|nr:hypothetical protein [Hyphomonadaceae bacterium]
MVPRFAILALAALAVAAPAAAQLKKGAGVPLKEAEATAALHGIEMQGYSPTLGISWKECIQPNGETLYTTPDGVRNGKLLVSPRGEACFSYEDDDYASISCFITTRNGADGLRFEGFGTIFITTRITKGVKVCKPYDLIG